MANITLNSAVQVFDNIQWNVLYEQFNAPQYPQQWGVLNVPLDSSTYTSGRLLSRYTAGNAPSAALIGTYINYDPAGDAAQQVPVAVISEEWVNGYPGFLNTNSGVAAATFRNIQVAPLLIGTTLYYNTLVANNPSEVITGFNAYFNLSDVSDIEVNQVKCPLITIQGVA